MPRRFSPEERQLAEAEAIPLEEARLRLAKARHAAALAAYHRKTGIWLMRPHKPKPAQKREPLWY